MIPYLQREEKRYLLNRPRTPAILIVGDGGNVFDDLEAFWDLNEDCDVGCINNIARVYPCDFQHFFAGDSHDADMREVCVSLNDKEVLTHCYNPMSETFAVRWFKENIGWLGTTAMFATIAALCLGYYRIILAGVPLDTSGRWYEAEEDKIGSDHGVHLWRWRQFRFRPWAYFVRSMSGNTAEILGRPTLEWLNRPYEILPPNQAVEWLNKPIETIKNLPTGI